MKIVSFNANGIRSAARKGFFEWLNEINPDIVCIQETKAQRIQLESESKFFPQGYYCEYVDAIKKGYSGVAIYARKEPLNVVKSLGFSHSDNEGRYLRFDYSDFSVISWYLPSGTSGDERQAIKYEFLDYAKQHLKTLKDEGRSLIICGDFNIAHTKKDIKNWRGNQKNSGFLPKERAWMDNLFDSLEFVDALRVVTQEDNLYTWWSNRGRAYENNVGWRIDYQVTTPDFAPKISSFDIYREIKFSDHAPLTISYTD